MANYTFYWKDGTISKTEECDPSVALNKTSRHHGVKPLAFYSINPNAQYHWHQGSWVHVEG